MGKERIKYFKFSGKDYKNIYSKDYITGLPDSGDLKKYLRKQISKIEGIKASICLVIVDVDEFKYINDALGYELANKLISKITDRLKTFDKKYSFLSRHFGVQFAIVMESDDELKDYYNLVKEIFELFSESFRISSNTLDLNVSIGASVSNTNKKNEILLIQEAQSALRNAKLSGKNRFEFFRNDEAEFSSMKKHFKLRNDLRKAIIENQFEVYYQPLVRLEEDRIESLEALIRWNHPQFGMVSPLEFIPIAEETGLIIDLGDWIIKEICIKYNHWKEKGIENINISLNISSIQFSEKNFVDKLIDTMNGFKVSPSSFIVEITESVLISNINKIREDMKRLQNIGVKIALDDFGTGFSSLMYLSKFDIDILKADKFFIEGLPEKSSNTIIFESILRLSRELGISFVAEGIESRDQCNYLRELGCPIAQGYFFSKPVSAERIEIYLCKEIT